MFTKFKFENQNGRVQFGDTGVDISVTFKWLLKKQDVLRVP
jgi:hypothetical protein